MKHYFWSELKNETVSESQSLCRTSSNIVEIKQITYVWKQGYEFGHANSLLTVNNTIL